MKTQEKASIFDYNGKKAMLLPESFVATNDNITVEYENNVITLQPTDKLAVFFNSYDIFDEEMPIIDDFPPEPDMLQAFTQKFAQI